jgi:hypothetical protein
MHDAMGEVMDREAQNDDNAVRGPKKMASIELAELAELRGVNHILFDDDDGCHSNWEPTQWPARM